MTLHEGLPTEHTDYTKNERGGLGSWLLAQKPWIVPIPGTTKRHRLEENNGAAALELTSSDLHEINAAADKITLQGERYPAHLQKLVGR
jgi:diketogulonate reductase-like aldo/keto reductase